MQKERKVIDDNIIVVFNNPVKASKLNSLLNDFYGDVIVNSDVAVDMNLNLHCNLHVIGDIECIHNNKINIDGDLYCDGDVDCYDICVSGIFYCSKYIDSADVMVGELITDEIQAYAAEIVVGGDLECDNINAERIFVFGKIEVKNSIICGIVKSNY